MVGVGWLMSDTFDIASFLFPIFSGTEKPEVFAIDAFLGTGFWINSNAYFLTCRHVFEALKAGQKLVLGQPYAEQRDRFLPVTEWQAHPKIDIALGRVLGTTKRPVLSPYPGRIATGLDVESFGFMSWEKRGRSLSMDARLLRGHVSRMYPEPDGLPAKSVFEVSFASPSGFSGAPLLAGHRVVGMLYGNIESRLQAFTLDEIKDGGREYKEVSYRIHEFGLAHPLEDVIGFTKKCGVEPFA